MIIKFILTQLCRAHLDEILDLISKRYVLCPGIKPSFYAVSPDIIDKMSGFFHIL